MSQTESPAGSPAEGVQPEDRRRRSLSTTNRDMLLSMLVIVGIVGLLLLLVPRPNVIPERTLDVTSAAQGASGQVGFVPVAPSLPGGWTARAASVERGTDGIPTWHLTYTTPSGRYAGVQEARDATPAWENRQVTDGREQGEIKIGSHSWIIRSRTDRGITSYVLREDKGDHTLTTVVTGTATADELATFTQAVAP